MLAKTRAISLLQSAIALALTVGCLFAAQWQFHRGTAQMDNNKIINANLQQKTLGSNELQGLDPVANQWREISLTGKFSRNLQELVRNRYNEGKFGFEVLTLFTTKSGDNFWVDRGWVAAGPNAATPPVVPEITNSEIEITARIRSENLSRQLQGSFFVTKTAAAKPLNMTKIQGINAEPYYLDLINSSDTSAQPLTQIQLPELTNGPHFAYALQWLAFAVLILLGRYLLFREAKRLSLV